MDVGQHFFLTVFLAAVFTGSLIYTLPFENVEGFSEAEDITVQDSRLIFSTPCFQLEMYVSASQAEQIELGLARFHGGIDAERPMMPELTKEVMKASDVELERVEVHSLQNRSYMADLVLSNGERVDSRPSDAVLMAAESDSPVFLSNELLRSEARNTCLESSQSI